MNNRKLCYQNNKRSYRLLFFFSKVLYSIYNATHYNTCKGELEMEEKTILELWELIDQKLLENKGPYQNLNAIYEFQITDQPESVYQLEFDQGQAIIHSKSEKEPACTLKLKEKHFKKFLTGDLNSTSAFMTGRLKIDGNIGLALKLESMLKQYDFSN